MNLKLSDDSIFAVVANFVCGYCSRQVGYNIIYAGHSELHSDYGDFLIGRGFAILQCRSCKMLNLVTLEIIEDIEQPVNSLFDEGFYLSQNPNILYAGYDPDSRSIQPVFAKLMGQFPAGLQISEKVPTVIRNDLEEATSCLCVNAPNAALLMCRKTIERVCIDQGVQIKKGTLGNMLQSLQSTGKIPQSIIDTFHEIKEWGNIGAHVKDAEYEAVELSDAKQVFSLVRLIVDQMYNQPDQEIIRKLRDRKKKHETNTNVDTSSEELPF